MRARIAAVAALGGLAGCAGSGPGAPAGPASPPGATAGVVTTATTPATPGPPAATGKLHLVTEAGPTCPVERAGAPPCVRPLPATVALIGAAGTLTLTTGETGVADVRVAPGEYTLHALSPAAGGSPVRPPADQPAVVAVGETVSVTLVWDTGIR